MVVALSMPSMIIANTGKIKSFLSMWARALPPAMIYDDRRYTGEILTLLTAEQILHTSGKKTV